MIEIVPYNEIVTCVKTAAGDEGEPIMWTYSYRVGNSLFDAGCANAKDELMKYITAEPVEAVYITHTHEDHIGACSVLSKDSTIYATKPVAEELRSPEQLTDFFRMVWGQPDPVEEIEELGNSFDIGDLHFDIVPLPGHNKNMVGFYEPNRGWLFSSDAVPLPSRKRLGMPEENLPQMIATMERILELNLSVLFDSHRGPIENPQDHIQIRIDYLKEFQVKVKELHSHGKSLAEIQDELGIEGPWYLEYTKDRFGVEYVLKSLLFDKAA
ncbi:MAG: MBL fold metallo-hydrolase [Candidatus Hodarchaeota archaeon]